MAQVACILLIVVAGFLWVYVSALSLELRGSDPAGNALAAGFAALGAIALWLLLAILLVVAGTAGEMPWWAGVAAVVLVPASGFAVQVGLEMAGRDGGYRWLAVVPMGVPGLIMVYAVWSVFLSAHALVNSRVLGIGVWGAISVLTALPLLAREARRRAIAAIPPKTTEELAAEKAARDAEYRKQRAATFASLTADSPFWQWWDFAQEGSEFRAEALAGLSKVNHREEQIAKIIEQGGRRELFLILPRLELRATPEIEGGVRVYLQDQVKYLMPYDPEKPMATTVVTEWFEQYFPTIRWLVGNGGSCNEELSAIAEAVRKYPDCPERQNFLAALGGLRKA
jgi:hypothetical protein